MSDDASRPATYDTVPSGDSGDMDAETFRAQGHRLVEWIADYLEHSDRYPVLAQVKPGEIAASLPQRRRLRANRSIASSTTSKS